MSEMDYNDLSILFDDDDISEKKEKDSKPKNKWTIPIAIVSIFAAVVGGLALLGSKEEQEQEQLQQAETTTTEEVPDNLSVQLVNLQQVAWADKACTTIEKWAEDKKELKPTGNETSPNKARKFISWDINRNLKRLSEVSQDFSDLPESALTQAKQLEKKTGPGDNNLKVGKEIDADISAASRGISSAIEGYSSAVKKLQSNLNSIADYNFNGIRDGIVKTNEDIANLSTQLEETLLQSFNEDTFSNIATLKKASELESCQGKLIDTDKLKSDKAEELDKMERIDRIVSVRRCKSYLDNTAEDAEDGTIAQHRSSCEDITTSIVLDPNDPFADARIDMKESQRVIPQGAQGDDGQSTQDDSKKKEIISTTSQEKSTSSSGVPAPSIADQSDDKGKVSGKDSERSTDTSKKTEGKDKN